MIGSIFYKAVFNALSTKLNDVRFYKDFGLDGKDLFDFLLFSMKNHWIDVEYFTYFLNDNKLLMPFLKYIIKPGMDHHKALRCFLSFYQFPRNSGDVDSLIEDWSNTFLDVTKSENIFDDIYVLAFVTIMLSTNQHSVTVVNLNQNQSLLFQEPYDFDKEYLNHIHDMTTKYRLRNIICFEYFGLISIQQHFFFITTWVELSCTIRDGRLICVKNQGEEIINEELTENNYAKKISDNELQMNFVTSQNKDILISFKNKIEKEKWLSALDWNILSKEYYKGCFPF